MKSFIKIALLVFYVFFNASLSYSMHFCGDDFQHINVFTEYKTCCESNTPMSGCCDDVSNLELPNSDQQLSDILSLQSQFAELIKAEFTFEIPVIFVAIQENTAFADYSPYIFHNTPIFIYCQVFLI